MPRVRTISRDTSADEAMAILWEDGGVVYENLVDEAVIHQVRAELDPYLERAYNGEGEFWGYKTKRVSSLIAKSKTYGEELATNPVILAVMDQILLPHCARYHLHVTQAVAIGPGEGQQIIHRDDGLMPFRHPGPQSVCNTMWALTDFTEENGATNVILGSQDWDDDTYPDENSEITHAVMPKGSCMIYLGSVFHGGGKNVTDNEYRVGMITGYSLGWLRQEENQYLAVPPEIAQQYDPVIRRLLGYTKHGDSLGHGHRPGGARVPHTPDDKSQTGLDLWVWDEG